MNLPYPWVLGCLATAYAAAAQDAPQRPAVRALLTVEDAYPHVTADGRVVFQSNRVGGSKLFIARLDGAEIRQLTRILFRRLLRQRTTEGTLINSEIMVMNRDGTQVVNLSKNAYFDGWPAWSPDGRRIAFSSNRSDLYQILVMNADGTGPTQVVESADTDVRPQWLPDGSGLIFNREHQGGIRLWRVELPQQP